MFLKNYQIKVVGELRRFFQTAETSDAIFEKYFRSILKRSIVKKSHNL